MALALARTNSQNLSVCVQPGTIVVGDVEKIVEAGSTMISILSHHKDGAENKSKDSEEFVAADQFIPPSGNKEDSNGAALGDLGPAVQKHLNICEGKSDSSASVPRQVTCSTRPENENDTTIAINKLGKKNNKRKVQQPPLKWGNRRRRRRAAAVMSSEDETEEESDSDSTTSSTSSQASQDSLSPAELTQDTQTFSESPTDSSSGSDTEPSDCSSKLENCFPPANLDIAADPDQGSQSLSGSRPQKNTMDIASSSTMGAAGRKGRSIVLAANFGAPSAGKLISSPQAAAAVSD